MGKFLKILAAILGLLVVLVIAAVIIVPLVVDPNDFKDEITAEVKKATGRELLMSGDLGLSVFPWLGLELNGLRLSNAPGFGDQPFAAVKHAQVRVKLMPLLSKVLEVDTLRVEGLQLNLAKAKDGRTNWQDLAGAEEPAAPAPTEEPAAKGPGLAGLAIGGVEVADARVVWDDRSSGQRYEVADFFLNTGAISPGQPVDLKLAFAIDSAQPLLKARVNLDGRLETDQALQKLSLSPLNLSVQDLQTEAVRGQVKLAAGVDADLAAQRYRLGDLRLDLAVAGEGLPKGGVEAELLADLVADLSAETLTLSGMKLTSGELVVSGALQGEKIQSAPSFERRPQDRRVQFAQLDAEDGAAGPGDRRPQGAQPSGAECAPEIVSQAGGSGKARNDPGRHPAERRGATPAPRQTRGPFRSGRGRHRPRSLSSPARRG